MHWLRQCLNGNRRALSRLITMIESAPERLDDVLAVIHLKAGRALSIGITGFPGAGKSTLVDKLIAAFRATGKTVAVLAVDPSSPFSGGAILGDRIRMGHGAADPGVFIRSLGSRGHLGGLSRSTRDVMKLLDAFGFDLILVETVGTGQSEVEIVRLVDTCLVTLVPGLGDDIQAIKAGILEIADLFVLNKRDHPGADRTRLELEAMLALSPSAGMNRTAAGCGVSNAGPPGAPGAAAGDDGNARAGWRPEIILTQANANLGINELVAAIGRHQAAMATSQELRRRRRERCRDELLDQMTWALRQRARAQLELPATEAIVRSLEARLCSPVRAARSLLAGDRILSIDPGNCAPGGGATGASAGALAITEAHHVRPPV